MSFYIAGKKRAKTLQDEILAVFNEFNYDEETNKRKFDAELSFVYCNHATKVIEDIFIQLEDAGSWVLLVGTPVIEAKTDPERYKFARELLNNPLDVIRHKIDGQFAVLAYDAERQIHIAATDWNSLIPVYYADYQGGLLLGNAELPLARLLKSGIDEVGFAQSIHYGAVWGGRTRFKNIQKLEACEVIRVDHKNNIKKERYWEPRMEELWGGSFNVISERWLGVMERAIRVYTDHRKGHKVSADLTGGEDSRLVVALLKDIGLPFSVRVAGERDDADVLIAKSAADVLNLDLVIEDSQVVTEEDLSRHVNQIISHSDGYGSFFTNASSYVHELHYRPMEYTNIHLCGMPGGGQYRGANYLRAKLLYPSRVKDIDYKAYTRRKFLIDYHSNLLKISDADYFESVFTVMDEALEEVAGFPAGIQVDHLMRVRYGTLLTANLKRPFYFAFAPGEMARSTYNVPPNMKKGGNQYKAIIEKLSPELAWIKTQSGVPTVRKTALRFPLFVPEYYSKFKKSVKGVARQMFREVPALRSKGHVNERHHLLALHEESLRWLFSTEPYSSWFESADSMLSGSQYHPDELNKLLDRARQRNFDQVQLFGRVINQEFALRKVHE